MSSIFDEIMKLEKAKRLFEKKAMSVLDWKRHLVKRGCDLAPPEIQKKKDYFLYKYYEYNYNKCEFLINKLYKTIWK